jgi:hypothetical protein
VVGLEERLAEWRRRHRVLVCKAWRAVACEAYDKLIRERDLAGDNYSTLIHPRNAHLHAGIPKTQHRRMIEDALKEMNDLSTRASQHRQSCPICNTLAI